MYKLLLVLMKLIWRIRESKPQWKLEGSLIPLYQEIDHELPQNWEAWFKKEDVAWIKGYRASPSSLSIQRSSATPPSLDRAPEAQPEVKEEEVDEVVDPESRQRDRLIFAMAALFLIAVSVSVLTGCDEPVSPPQRGVVFDGSPPLKFQGDANVTVRYVTNIEEACYAAGLERIPNTVVQACTITSVYPAIVFLPNPCQRGGDKTTCHELGHVNGWPATH